MNLFLAAIRCNRYDSHSDGGGRSGVYIAIDANLELAEEEDSFHVFGYLKKLRQARKGLIENVVCNENSHLLPNNDIECILIAHFIRFCHNRNNINLCTIHWRSI